MFPWGTVSLAISIPQDLNCADIFFFVTQNKDDKIHEEDFVQGWELLGRAAIRKGNWKAVFIPKPKGTEKWQLYNLSVDAGEVNDLADSEPEILKELLRLWDNYVLENGVIPLQPELGEYIEALEGQMTVSDYFWSF